ncbi:MAG: CHAT domain-containing protein [Microcoleaceae cyanobacterium]
MSKAELIGKSHNAHLGWLLNTWMSRSSSPVCFLEGFPGTGKTTIAREMLTRMHASKGTAIMITAPETEADPTDNLLLDLAMELNSAGRDELAKAIENNRPLLDVLSTIVNDPILIIIDEFQRSMQGTRAITLGGFAKVLSTLANRKWLKGRILLLTNRLVERARWSEAYAIRTLNGMSPDDGVELLEHLAQEDQRLDEIAPERRHDVVKWLGGNPRAIKLLVRSLAYDSLDDLIGIQPELWEMNDQEVSADLVEDLERQILEKTLNQLSDLTLLCLYSLAVHRKPFKRQAIEYLFSDKAEYAQFKRDCIDRFLMEQHNSWFTLHPIAREIGLQKLGQLPNGLQQAHNAASRYYTRHFEAQQIVGWGALGGYFVESRYHLVKAGRPDDLKNIAPRFQSHVFSTLSGSSPIPHDREERDERIAVLSALLETPGPKSLEYHLARLFQARNQRNDLGRALHHAHRAKSEKSSVAWLLCSELLIQMERYEESINILKQGIDRVSPESNLADLFTRCSKLLAQNKRYDEAISLLLTGIDRIPPDKSLASLYITCGGLLSEMKRHSEAITLLQQGIDQIPIDKSLADLFNRCSGLLVEMEQYDKAIAVLKRGIKQIPTDKSLVILYHSYGELLAKLGKYDEAIKVLEQGIKRIPVDKSLTTLYYSCGNLLAQTGKTTKAIVVLKQGINHIHIDKCLFPLYSRCGELMFQVGHRDDAISLLREGIDRIPPEQGASIIYHTCAKLLILSNKAIEAIEILSKGITEIPVQYNPYSLVEFILLLYAALRDEHELNRFLQTIKGIQPQHAALAKTLLQQLQSRYESAAEYAKNLRKSGTRYPLLSTIEAFSWLCCGQPERALDAIFVNLKEGKYFDQWLHAFIQLRLGNFDEAKQALTTYEAPISLLQDEVDETTLLSLWDQPSENLENYDLAYYFPTLPTALTGLPYPVTRIVYHSSVLPAHIKSKSSALSRPTQKHESKTRNIKVEAIDMQENYVDFDLHIAADGHATAKSPEGEATADISTQQPSSIRLSLELIERRKTDADLLKEVGRSLYDWLFPNSIHTHLQQTEAVARQNKAKLRLRLRVESPTIASLPLEFIYRAMGGYFLAANPDTVFSRYLNLPLPQERVRRRDTPLHVLAIVADPTDQVRLDPDEWETILKEALDAQLTDGNMTLQIVKRATYQEIRNALLAQKPDVIQFVGHGIYKDGKGHLALVDEDTNQTWSVDGERFANIFMGYNDHLGLISMATCESAQSDNPQGFLGIAPQLVQRGTPAVVAMQYSVYIKTAKVFLEDFYTCVASHKPIDWAVQSARNAISLKFGLGDREFATPVLYMRAKDGNIF